MNAFAVQPVRAAALPATNERTNPLENIVLLDRTSILLLVLAEDAAYVVGVYADIRGLPVDDERRRVDKTAIALRIQITKELRGNPDTLSYSHRKADGS